jgi:hypothetical protein
MARKKFWTYTRPTMERYSGSLGYAWGAWNVDATVAFRYFQLFNNDGAGRSLLVYSEADDFTGLATIMFMRNSAFGSVLGASNFQHASARFGPAGGVSPYNNNGQQPPGQMLYSTSGSPIGDVPIGIISISQGLSFNSAAGPIAIIPPGSGLIVSGDGQVNEVCVAFIFAAVNL